MMGACIGRLTGRNSSLASDVERIDVSKFKTDDSLFEGESVVVVIKNFERLEIIRRVKDRRKGLNLAPSSPRKGAIAVVTLNGSRIDDSVLTAGTLATCRSPYEFVQSPDGFAFYNSYDSLHRASSLGDKSYSDDIMRRLHSVDLSKSEDLILASSSGFDTLHFFDKELNLKSQISLWELHPKIAQIDGYTLCLEEFEPPKIANTVFGPLKPVGPKHTPNGLGVQQSPFYLSGASFSSDGSVLFTGYNSPSVYVLADRTISEANLGLRSPHCFREIKLTGAKRSYCVVDSGHGRLLFLRDDLSVYREVSLETLDRPNGSEEQGDWLQYAEYQDSGNLLLIADQRRSRIHVLDIPGRRRRSIDYPKTWSIHGIHHMTASQLKHILPGAERR